MQIGSVEKWLWNPENPKIIRLQRIQTATSSKLFSSSIHIKAKINFGENALQQILLTQA